MSVEAAARLLAALEGRGLRLATAESLTGGLVASAITAVPGASSCFRGGAVAYATEVKTSVLGVPRELLAQHGPVSHVTAAAMALAAVEVFDADVGLATTGVAGPDPVGPHPPGLVFVAAVLRGEAPQVRRLQLAGDRQQVRQACVLAVLELAIAVLASDSGE